MDGPTDGPADLAMPEEVPGTQASLGIGIAAFPAATALQRGSGAARPETLVSANPLVSPARFDALGSSRPGVARATQPACPPGRSMMAALALQAAQTGVERLPHYRGQPGRLGWRPEADAAEFGSDGTPGTQPQALDVLAVPSLRCLRAKGPIGSLRSPLEYASGG
jgi:hypothetical protein